MKYQEIKGDLIELAKKGKFDVIAHGCNCYKTMGAGIAYQISKHFPNAYSVDKNDKRLPIQRLGDYTQYMSGDCMIVNLYTQYKPGKDLNYNALNLSLYKLNKKFSGCTIGLPLIGCGIAGGDWNKVKSIIQEELKDCNVTVVFYDRLPEQLNWWDKFIRWFKKGQ